MAAGATSEILLGGGSTENGTNFDQLAEDHRLLIGSIICAADSVRDRLFRMLTPGDLDTPLAADALEILRALHCDGVTDRGSLTQQFAETVTGRRRAPRQPDAAIPARYPVGPIHWIAKAFSDAAHLGEHGAVVLALQYTGTGRRRAIAHAAAELARAARNPEFDQDDIDVAAERLLKLLGVAS